MNKLIKKKDTNKEYKELLFKVHELNQIQQDLINCIDSQDIKLDSIENNLESTMINLDSGNKDLKIANGYYFRYTPIIIGSAIGTAIAGPLGAVTSAKLLSVITLSGTFLGGILGYKIQKI